MKIACVCSMNINRSMSIHTLLHTNNINITSFGSSEKIRLPGLRPPQVHEFTFDHSYNQIYQKLANTNTSFYEGTGILKILKRNMQIKEKPENIYDHISKHGHCDFDVIITCGQSIFKSVMKFFQQTGNSFVEKGFYVVNFDMTDEISTAQEEANDVLFFVQVLISGNGSLEQKLDNAICEFYKTKKKELLCTAIDIVM